MKLILVYLINILYIQIVHLAYIYHCQKSAVLSMSASISLSPSWKQN